MANNQQNTHINRSFNTEIADSDCIEVFATDDTYEKLSSVYKEDPYHYDHIRSHTIKPRPSENCYRQKIQISLWLLFLIIICILIALVVTGVVTFFITKERFSVTQCESKNECYWTAWSSWSGCSITCGKGDQVRVRQHMNSSMLCNYNETFNLRTCTSDPCFGDDDILDMRFSRTALYKYWFISADNTIISNVHIIETSSSADAQLQNYMGTISDICVGDNELIFFEVDYTYTIVKSLTADILVLEIGLAERSKVDRNYSVALKNVGGWSFFVAKTINSDKVNLYSHHDGSSRQTLKSISDFTAGTKVQGKFELFINRRKNEFLLRQDDSILVFHVLTNVISSEKLCPVFGVYNYQWVHVKLQLMNPRNYTYYPW
ncbi:uncharacterized protein LOC127705230 [Mytilus californianus]|uniref:uncharacterized protein LOC127705230 n=1 Tax=Mytilus californianus TaxID=6549 RepID=UPI002246CCBC|nr:uncharacterized protein LOC127705230 [Mytilus californianus]